MKALVLTSGMLISIITVKAQQNTLRNFNKTKPDTSYRSLYKGDLGWPSLNSNVPVLSLNKSLIVTKIPGNMPIAKLPDTDTSMPVVQTDKTGYTMPVAGMSLPRVYNKQKSDGVMVPRP